MPHEIHTSERRSFRGCKRRWDWAYREGYVPYETAKPLEFGIAFHEALEVFYDPKTWDETTPEQKLSNAVQRFNEICREQQQRFLEVTNQRTLDQAQGDDYQERIELGIGMLANHMLTVHPSDHWFRPVQTEVSFAVPLFDPLTGEMLECHNSPACGQDHENSGPLSQVVYAGRVDMLIEDKLNGGYYVWDHKTTSQLIGNEEHLQLDDQIGGYCWALGHELGIDIKGFMYAEYRKDYPRPPKELKRLYKGCRFSTSATQATSLEVFLPFVEQHDKEALDSGCYDEYITFLKSKDAPKFHQRFPILKTDRELANIGCNIVDEAMDMVDPHLRIYPSPGKFSCSNCAYRQPCLGKQMGEDYQYTLDNLYNKVAYRYYHQQEVKDANA